MATLDPVTTATQLATAYTQATQTRLTTQTQTAQKESTALNTLKSALSAFDSTLTTLSLSKGLKQFAASFNNSGIATATTTSKAQAGSYQFHVEQLASAHQVVFEDLPAVPVALGGPITVQLQDGSSFNVNLVAADSDSDGTISQAEIARAINQANGNSGKVVASVVTSGGQSQLLLSSGQTGEGGEITINAGSLPAGALQDAFNAPRELTAAQDAVVWLGGQGGVRMQQASNTFNSIEGVSLTFTRAMTASESPLTLTVSDDASGTASNVESFVKAYNTLRTALDTLTKAGGENTTGGVFASDAGIRALGNKLNSLLRTEYDGISLTELGVKADRNGQLSLDKTRLEKALLADPAALDKVFGKASVSAPTGLLGGMAKYLDQWTTSGSGQIATRQNSIQIQQKNLTARQTRLDAQYNSVYQRYLQQFTQLATLQERMAQTSGLFAQVSTG
ncbi:flagellar filament capping protein FliD [Peristeroidobacter soli]|jgi:flagellar hook-associated protein 2|uniref:flagellar filament capping protein FliD n=1 Tax=Peristeroidobacter soli TaxID=2497877 RepID=UPI00101D3E92|nr:flagellar filament capping protein FliD [Peristeroidobacter soli]